MIEIKSSKLPIPKLNEENKLVNMPMFVISIMKAAQKITIKKTAVFFDFLLLLYKRKQIKKINCKNTITCIFSQCVNPFPPSLKK